MKKTKTIKLIQKNRLKLDKEDKKIIKSLQENATELYNESIKNARKYFNNNNRVISFNENCYLCKDYFTFKSLPNPVAQKIINSSIQEFKIFSRLLKLKKEGKYFDNIKMPVPNKKNIDVPIPINILEIKDNKAILKIPETLIRKNNLSKNKIEFFIPKNINKRNLKQIDIVQEYGEYYTEYRYEKKVNIENAIDFNKYLSIDVGLANLSACFDATDGKSFLIDGGYIKSINYEYSRKKMLLKEKLAKQNIKSSKKLKKLQREQNSKIKSYFDLAAKRLIEYAIKKQIGSIVVGKISNMKTRVFIKDNKQVNMENIPFGIYLRKLEDKCKQVGIKFYTQDESFTSLCSFLDNEEVKEKNEYYGKRISRDRFRTLSGKEIDADVNAAGNILVKFLERTGKAVPQVVKKRIGYMENPEKFNIKTLQKPNIIYEKINGYSNSINKRNSNSYNYLNNI